MGTQVIKRFLSFQTIQHFNDVRNHLWKGMMHSNAELAQQTNESGVTVMSMTQTRTL